MNSIYITPTKSLELENLNHYPRISLGIDGQIAKNWYYDLNVTYVNLDICKAVGFDDNLKTIKIVFYRRHQPTLKNMLQQVKAKCLEVFLQNDIRINRWVLLSGLCNRVFITLAQMHDHRIGGQVYFESNLSFENID